MAGFIRTYISLVFGYDNSYIAIKIVMMQTVLLVILSIGILESTVSGSLSREEHYHDEQNSHELAVAISEIFMKAGNVPNGLLESGGIVCPPTNLDAPLKQQVIHIGVAGCNVDPVISTLSSLQQSHLPPQGRNATCNPNLAGYLPPIPGITLL